MTPDKGTKEIFIYAEEKGKKVSVVKMWTKPSLDRIVNQATLFEIEVQSVEVLDVESKKKGFSLEYLNGYIPKGGSRGTAQGWGK